MFNFEEPEDKPRRSIPKRPGAVTKNGFTEQSTPEKNVPDLSKNPVKFV